MTSKVVKLKDINLERLKHEICTSCGTDTMWLKVDRTDPTWPVKYNICALCGQDSNLHPITNEKWYTKFLPCGYSSPGF